MPATQVKLNQLKQASATTGQVISWDGTGWTPTTLSSGGTSSGTSGTIQYSNGSGGFSGDPSNLFWNSTTKSLQITGTSSAYAGVFSGDGGGINISQATNLTATYTGVNISGNNTQNIRAQITNTNNASATSHASLRLGAALGDPFIIFSPTANEAGAVIAGIDNSSTGDIFYISRGSDPSTMTGAQFRLDGNTDSVSIRSASDAAFFRATTSTATVSGTTTDVIGGTSNINIVNAGVTVTSPLFYVGGGSGASSTLTVGAGGSAQFVYSNVASGVILDDANASVTLWPRDGSRNLTVNNTGVTVQSPNGFGIRNSAGSGTTFLASPAGTFSNTLTFPSTTGTTGQFLSTNGSGVLSWSNPGDNASVISPTQLTSDQNNYDPTGFSTASIVRLDGDNGMRVITGLAAPTSGTSYRQVTFTNVGSFTILFTSEDSDSTAANRIVIEEKVFALYPRTSATFYYDNVSDRWRVLETTSIASENPRCKFIPRNQLSTTAAHSWINNTASGGSVQNGSTPSASDLFVFNTHFATGATSALAYSGTNTDFKIVRTNTTLSRTANCLIFRARISTDFSGISDATNRYAIRAGIFNNTGNSAGGVLSASPVGIYFTYTDNENSGRWILRSRTSGALVTDSNSTVTIATNTVYLLEFVLLPDNKVMCYIDNTLISKTSPANFPTNDQFHAGIGIIKSVGISSRSFQVETLSSTTILR